jgi:hypothetical protein
VKRLMMISYTYHDGLSMQARQEMVRLFSADSGTPGAIAQYERIDGRGGFIIQEELHGQDLQKDFEQTVAFAPFLSTEMYAITTIEDAYPIMQRVYG